MANDCSVDECSIGPSKITSTSGLRVVKKPAFGETLTTWAPPIYCMFHWGLVSNTFPSDELRAGSIKNVKFSPALSGSIGVNVRILFAEFQEVLLST